VSPRARPPGLTGVGPREVRLPRLASSGGVGSPGVAVVTVTHSPGEALERFLDSVRAASADGPVPVLLADLGSADGAPERAARREGVGLLRLGEVVVWAAAVNRAVAQLCPDTDWVAVADPDVRWGAGSLDELLAAAARHPRAGMLGPALRTPEGAVVGSAFAQATLPELMRGRPPARMHGGGPVGWLVPSCLLLRRAAWESVDGFDARHPAPYDAVDYAARLARAGWLAVAVPSSVVTVAARPVPAVPDDARRHLAVHPPGLARTAAGLVLRARRAL